MTISKLCKLFLIYILILVLNRSIYADDGYRLWLKYDKITDTRILNSYKKSIKTQLIIGNSATSLIIRNELSLAFQGLFGEAITESNAINANTLIIHKIY